MNTYIAYLVAIRFGVCAILLSFPWASIAFADDKSSGPAFPDKSVHERGVLNAQGVIVQGNQLKAASGYVLEKGSNNQMTARPKQGGGAGPEVQATCGCTGGSGVCMILFDADVAICSKHPTAPCNGKCEWTVGPPSKVGPPRGR